MTSISSASVDDICRTLKQSPLFQLSLASKELFHSNLLAWLCQTYYDHAGRLFAAFLSHIPPTYEGLDVRREHLNTDLWLKYPEGEELVIENKVKSLATIQQLEDLTRKAQNKARTSFLLLSLARPPFLPLNDTIIRLSDGTVWRYLTYRQLADKLRDLVAHIAVIDVYHSQLLCDYVTFITHLDALQARFIIDWDNEGEDFFIAENQMKRLRCVRLHDLIDKIRYAQLERCVGDALRDEGFPTVRHEKLRDGHEGQPGLVLLSADMTRGVGLFDLKYFVMDKHRLGNPVILGIQVQGNQFRLVVEVAGEHKNRALEIAKALWQHGGSKRLWFDFGRLPGGSGEYPQDGECNQYSGVFFYRSKRLQSISPRRLADTIVAYAQYLRTNQRPILQRIESVLKDGDKS